MKKAVGEKKAHKTLDGPSGAVIQSHPAVFLRPVTGVERIAPPANPTPARGCGVITPTSNHLSGPEYTR